ncbi:MAG TPA: CPBP family intramembrane glutamic endopeptidase [Verrucomicrobiae bacterium]|nr:CPBP family intramembrane glutamic endopeptidase [Verrucomicrobiae bacterium]
MELLKSPRMHFYFGCFTEAALLGVAAVVAFLFDYEIFRDLSWRTMDLLWGILATVPMLASFGWVLNSSGRFASDIRRFFERVIRPMFGEWSIAQLAIISLLAGLCEEVLFRGALQGGLTAKIGAPGALVISSVAFGLAHPVSRQYIMAAGLIGFFLGGLFIATGNLLAPIVAHALYDFCALTWFLRLHRGDPR